MTKPSQLEIFPDELFLELFSYIPPIELYHVWYGLNHRFNAILHSVRLSLDLIENTDQNNDILNHFPSQIVYIHIRIPWDSLDFKQFPNLHSLIIDTELTKEQIQSIQPMILPSLRRLTFTKAWKDLESLNETIFNRTSSNQWIKVYHLTSIPEYFLHQSSTLSHIQTMIFDRMTSYDIHLILSFQTTLRRLKATIVSSISDNQISQMSFNDHKYLIDFHPTMNTFNKLDDLYPLLSRLSSLRYLHLACDSLTINDFQQLALELNTRTPWLERFHGIFKQTYIENMEKIYSMSSLFARMNCRKVEWIGGWYYYCVMTENV